MPGGIRRVSKWSEKSGEEDMTDFVVAEAAIRQLHSRYVDAAFRKDFDAFGDCFVQDCEWRIGSYALKGRAEIVETFKGFAKNFRQILVTLRTPTLEVGDGVASGRTYLTEQNVLMDGTAHNPVGIYYEHFKDCGDRWRFTWRLFQTHYSGPPDMSGTFIEQPDYGPPPAMPPRDAMPGSYKSTLV